MTNLTPSVPSGTDDVAPVNHTVNAPASWTTLSSSGSGSLGFSAATSTGKGPADFTDGSVTFSGMGGSALARVVLDPASSFTVLASATISSTNLSFTFESLGMEQDPHVLIVQWKDDSSGVLPANATIGCGVVANDWGIDR